MADCCVVSVTAHDDLCTIGARLNRVAAWQFRERTLDIFVDLGRDLAALCSGVWVKIEYGAILNSTTVARACIDGALEKVTIPAHQEVAMEPVSSWITHRPDKWLTVSVPHVLELVDIPQDFVEDGYKMDRMGVRTFPVVVRTDRIGHVGLVIRSVKVLSIPARREENLRSKTVGTVHVWEGRSFGISGILVVIEAVVTDSVGRGVIARRSLEGVTGNHPETFGESLQLVVVRARPLQVVNQTTTHLVNFLEGTILMLVVKDRSPVIGEITMDGTGGAS